MNYINRLEQENADLQAKLQAAQAEIQAFRSHLVSSKFINIEGQERNDWIATSDVFNWLRSIEQETV